MTADTIPAPSKWQSSALPPKVLIRILNFAVDASWPYLPVCILNLSHVCRLWRNAALSPIGEGLWRDVDFSSKLATSCLPLVDEKQFLSVRLTGSSNPYNRPEDYDKLKKYIARIERLMIRPDNYNDIAQIMKFFVRHKPVEGVLKTLYISEETNWKFSEGKHVSQPLSKRIPERLLGEFGNARGLSGVENLLLDAVEIPFKSSLYDNLIHLDLFDFKPRRCPCDLIRVLRRSPQLQILSLDSVLADSDSPVVPSAELLQLRTLTLTSSYIRSTAFFLDHIYAPNLENLDIDVTSDGQGSEFQRILKPLMSWNAIENIRSLRLNSHPATGAPFLSGQSKTHRRPSEISITIHECAWSEQRALVKYFPKVCKLELLADCPLGHLLRGPSLDNLIHLRIHNNVNFRLLKHLRPNGRFSRVRTLDLNYIGFLKKPVSGDNVDFVSVTECISNLEHSNNLQVLRLYGCQGGLDVEDVQAFDDYGLGEGVIVHWAAPTCSRLPFFPSSSDSAKPSCPDLAVSSMPSGATSMSTGKKTPKRRVAEALYPNSSAKRVKLSADTALKQGNQGLCHTYLNKIDVSMKSEMERKCQTESVTAKPVGNRRVLSPAWVD